MARLTFYRGWQDEDGEGLDGTNNATERAIGWWVKERYRTMRGYKREQSVLNVSRLIAWSGSQLKTGGADLAAVVKLSHESQQGPPLPSPLRRHSSTTL